MKTEVDVEAMICDLPRLAFAVREVFQAQFGPHMAMPSERDEAVIMLLDELYKRTLELRRAFVGDELNKEAFPASGPEPIE
jgi:hypothetical protein